MSFQAKADVLFIDLNGAPQEVAAAERAAKARGEKLIVLPKRDPQMVKRIARTEADYKKVYADVLNNCVQKNDFSSNSCQKLVREEKEKSQAYWTEKNKIKLTEDSLRKNLSELEENKVEVSSMVISGHDGTGNFGGTDGNINAPQIGNFGKEYPGVFKNMRGLMLWGCYTSTPGAVLGTWKKAFPNVELIAGYDGRAPLANSPSSSTYLEDVLIKEKELAKIKDKNELGVAFKKIKDVTNVHSAICSGDLFANKEGVADLVALKNMCNSMPIDKWNERLTCFRAGEAGCENVPKDTAAGELRQIYNEVHAVEHCRTLAPEKSVGLPDPQTTLRLLFFEDVKKNFLANHKDVIPSLDDTLKKLGAPDSLLLGNIEKLSRADLVKKLQSIGEFINDREKNNDALHDASLAEMIKAKSLHLGISTTLADVNPVCVGFDWVEPGATTKSICVAQQPPESYAQQAEAVRGMTIQGNIKRKIANIVNSDPELQELAKAAVSPTQQVEKIRSISEQVAKKYEAELNKAVQEEKADLANQPAVPKDSSKIGFSREEVLKSFENPDRINALVKSYVSNKIFPSGGAAGMGIGMGGGIHVGGERLRQNTPATEPALIPLPGANGNGTR